MVTKINNIKPNPRNPRLIRDSRFDSLCTSLREFPEMLEKRPLVCFTDTDGKFVVLGGNMRLKAAKEIGLKELPIMLADDWTAEQKDQFLIKDNLNFGEFNFDELAADWDVEQLEAWGLEHDWEVEQDYSDKNKEFNPNDFDNQNYTIKLEFNEDDYNFVKDKIQQLGQTAEKILYDALVSL